MSAPSPAAVIGRERGLRAGSRLALAAALALAQLARPAMSPVGRIRPEASP